VSRPEHYLKLQIDYDGIPEERVREECESIKAKYGLGDYVIVPSRTGGHFHVSFPKSRIPTFDEAVKILRETSCDPDWLELSIKYGCFGIRQKTLSGVRESRRLKMPKPKPALINSPVILDLTPSTLLDLDRATKLCATFKDGTKYATTRPLADLKTHIIVGCTDERQGQRRIKWLQERGVSFQSSVKPQQS